MERVVLLLHNLPLFAVARASVWDVIPKVLDLSMLYA